jgi:hypothetical protein
VPDGLVFAYLAETNAEFLAPSRTRNDPNRFHPMKPTMRIKLLRILSLAVFFLGIVIGLILAIIPVWGQLEAINYYFVGVKYEPFDGLHCPIMIAPSEKGIVTAVFNNPTDREDNVLYRAEISGAVSTREVEGQIMVFPDDTKSIQLTVDVNDVDLRFFIFVKMNILPNALHPSQEAVCGIMVVNVLGLSGSQLSAVALSLSLLGIVIGLGVWQQTSTNADQNMRRVLITLGLVLLLAMFASAMGWWIAALALAVITVLLIVISSYFAIA